MKADNMEHDLPVKAARTTFRIIEELVELQGATVTDLSEQLGIAKSTTHDHLGTLCQLGYVVRKGNEYYISTRFLLLGERSRQDMKLYTVAQPELNRLAEQTGEYASLTIEENGKAIILATEKGQAAVPLKVYNGIRMRIHATAPGKAILAYLPEERVQEILDQHGLDQITQNTITDERVLFEELEQIREQGYALGHEERVTGIRTIGAPIVDRGGHVLGAVSIWGPTNRIGDERFREDIPHQVLESANIIEIRMNYE